MQCTAALFFVYCAFVFFVESVCGAITHERLRRALPSGAEIGYIPSLLFCSVSGCFSAYSISHGSTDIYRLIAPSIVLVVCSELRVFSYYRSTPVAPLAMFALYRCMLYSCANMLAYRGSSNTSVCPS